MMDTVKSFKGYGKVDEAEQATFKNKLRKQIICISISTIILIAIVATAIAAFKTTRRNAATSSSSSPAQSLKSVCSVTQYPDTCFTSLSPLALNTTNNPKQIFSFSLKVAKDDVEKLKSHLPNVTTNDVVSKAVHNCHDLFDDTVDRLEECISTLYLSSDNVHDWRTWLSAALTNQETCLDGLREINGTTSLVNDLHNAMQNSSELVSNSLAIVTKIVSILGKFKIPNFHNRKLLGYENNGVVPGWVGPVERRVMQEKPVPDKVVAKDGSGDYKTIGEAISVVPLKSDKRYVIYVKEGEYKENVVIGKHVWNVMVYGDGMDKSIVTGSLNFIDGTPTFSTATFAVAGRGFIAKDMAFKNTAGAAKHQAVALRSQSDRSIFYRCLFDGYQDTLYAHSHNQFYRDCTITGTIDFIFGNAAVVFQNCRIQPRQPLQNQFNTITAQGKKDPNQNTGISIQKCTMSAMDKLTAPTYLGRPWKEFSTTVIMQSNIGLALQPLGWIEWVSGVEPASTIYYAEYQNTGPGADVSKRVKWAGYKPTISSNEASKFTVGNFIDGNSWLGDGKVEFETAL